ncbi:MAG: DUF2442 domain-containing protein, partial [Bacteroidota bacterium]
STAKQDQAPRLMKNDPLLIQVKTAKHITDYKIELTLSNGLTGVVNLGDEIWGEVFEPLKNVNYFKTFEKDRWTIGWDCGADFAPEFLYELMHKQRKTVPKPYNMIRDLSLFTKNF